MAQQKVRGGGKYFFFRERQYNITHLDARTHHTHITHAQHTHITQHKHKHNHRHTHARTYVYTCVCTHVYTHIRTQGPQHAQHAHTLTDVHS